MASIQRHRYGSQGIVVMPVASATVVEVGDMVGEDGSGNVLTAAQETWNTTLLITQNDFKAVFVGVAIEASAAGEVRDIAVATEGIFEMDCASATFDIMDTVGPDENPSSLLADQEVEAAVIASALGEVVRDYAVATTRVLVRFFKHGRHDAP